jgi:hypothetical protein
MSYLIAILISMVPSHRMPTAELAGRYAGTPVNYMMVTALDMSYSADLAGCKVSVGGCWGNDQESNQ